MIHQHFFTGLVAVVHRLQLRTGHVAFIHDQQPVVREIINQTFGRCARLSTRQMPGVILHALAVTHLVEHLKVVLGALLQPLRLQQFAFAIETIQPISEFRTDRLNRIVQAIFRSDEVLRRINVDVLQALQNLSGGGVHVADRLHLITKQLNPNQPIVVGRTNLQHVALHPETTPGDFRVVTAVLVVHQLPQLTTDIHRCPHFELHCCLEVFTGNPQAVDAADRGHHDHIAALK